MLSIERGNCQCRPDLESFGPRPPKVPPTVINLNPPTDFSPVACRRINHILNFQVD